MMTEFQTAKPTLKKIKPLWYTSTKQVTTLQTDAVLSFIKIHYISLCITFHCRAYPEKKGEEKLIQRPLFVPRILIATQKIS